MKHEQHLISQYPIFYQLHQGLEKGEKNRDTQISKIAPYSHNYLQELNGAWEMDLAKSLLENSKLLSTLMKSERSSRQKKKDVKSNYEMMFVKSSGS